MGAGNEAEDFKLSVFEVRALTKKIRHQKDYDHDKVKSQQEAVSMKNFEPYLQSQKGAHQRVHCNSLLCEHAA